MRNIKGRFAAAITVTGALVLGAPSAMAGEGFDDSLCASDPISADGDQAEDIAAWMQVVGAPMNMHVKVFQSIANPDRKYIAAADPFYGVIVNMHEDNTICTMKPEEAAKVFKEGEIYELPINPDPNLKI